MSAACMECCLVLCHINPQFLRPGQFMDGTTTAYAESFIHFYAGHTSELTEGFTTLLLCD